MTRPIRVAIDARDLTAPAQRGMARYIVGLATHLPSCGVRVTLFHRAREPLVPEHLRGIGCDAIGLPDRGGVYWEQVSVPRALVRGNFDVYHAAAERGVPLAAPCPVALSIHSATAESFASLVRRGLLPGPVARYLGYEPGRRNLRWQTWYARSQLGRADRFFTVSKFAREELIRLMHLPAPRVTATPLGLSEEFSAAANPVAAARTRHRLGLRQPYLLYVGGFEVHKNPSGILAAAEEVRRARPDMAVVLVGTGPVPGRLLREAQDLGSVPGRDAMFLSDLRDDLVHVYDGASVFVSRSWRESFGLPALEAMARGLPTVVSSWGAGPEVIGDAGECVDPRDPATAAIMRALDPANRARAGVRGPRRAAGFTWAKTAAATAAVYRRMISGGAS